MQFKPASGSSQENSIYSNAVDGNKSPFWIPVAGASQTCTHTLQEERPW